MARNIILQGLAERVREFRDDESGLSLIEFGFVAPFFIAMYAGFVSILDTENHSSQVGKVSAAVADIIAQSPEVSAEYINGAFDAGRALLGAEQASNLTLVVAGIEIEDDETVVTHWVCSRNFSGSGGAAQTITVPDDLKKHRGFLVASFASYKHTPIFADSFGGEQTYNYRNFFVPRVSLKTLSDGC